MSVPHLFGPLKPEYADQLISKQRRSGTCLMFGPDGSDVVAAPTDSWTEISAKIPAGFDPQFLALWLAYAQIPAGIWDAPIPIVGLAADWNLLFHRYRRDYLPRCDLILTDVPGVAVIKKAGFEHAQVANLFGLEQAFLDYDLATVERDIDVLFVGNLHVAVQAERLPWLARLAQLGQRWNVQIVSGVFGAEYRRLLRRAKIVFNRSIRGECNKRVFEAAWAGALLFQEADNAEIRNWLQEDTEFVPYTAENLEARIEYFLEHGDERRAIIEAARARAGQCDFGTCWFNTATKLAEQLPALRERAERRQARAPASPPSSAAAEPIAVLDGLRQAELAVQAGQTAQAISLARQTLDRLERTDALPPAAVYTEPWTRGFDVTRVEWERCAWLNAGDSVAELRSKQTLLRWRLHLLLADLTGDLAHFHEAVLARPDLPVSRAALGCALARAGRPVESRSHLALAVAGQPFDTAAARALGQILLDLGDTAARQTLEQQRRLLVKAAPAVLSVEDWFAPRPTAQGLASIIILCCNEVEATRRCLESVRQHTRQPYELILVDNGSVDDTPTLLTEVRLTWSEPVLVEVIQNETNRGYPAGVNQGLTAAQGDFIVLLNNDTVVTPEWLDGLIRAVLAEGEPALVGPVSNYAPPPQFVPPGYDDLSGLDAFAAAHQREFAGRILDHPRLTGFCLLLPRSALRRIGGMDERYGAGFFDDDDLCVRARQAGLRLRVALDVYIHHEGSRTFRALGIDTDAQLQRNFEQFRAKWGDEQAAPYRRTALNSSVPMTAVPVVSGPEPLFSVVSAPAGIAAKPRKSLTMIVKNEEKNLRDCLLCVRDLVDEMIVVDTGSSDRTKEIAAEMGAKVFDFPWVDSFAAARNEAIGHATGDWIFWLDADDRMDEANRQKLKRLFDNIGLENTAYDMKCRCVGAFPGDTETIVDHVRLFRNDPRIRWKYRVHEQILRALRQAGAEVRFSDVEIQHVGYVDAELKKRKQQRDLRLLLMSDAEEPNDPFILFNLASSYLELGQPNDALLYAQRSLELSDPSDSIVRKLYSMLARAHRLLAQPAQAIVACTNGRTHYLDDPELLIVEAWAREDLSDFAGAEFCLRRLIDGSEPGDHFASVAAGLRGHLGRHHLAQVLYKQKRFVEAEAQWRTALTSCPEYTPARFGIGDLYVRTERWDALEGIAAELGDTVEAAVLRGRARLARKEFGAARWAFADAIDRFPQAILPRVLLSHALLQEGKDWDAAERALRDVLNCDPGNAEARNNLSVLLRQQNRHIDVASDSSGSAP